MTYSGTNIGSATGAFSVASGTYTVAATGGSGITGTSDSLYFVNQSVTGNSELIAEVASQTGTNAYACSGLMVSDLSSSYPAAAQCALIGVCPQNGINFWYRTADNTVAISTLGPSIAAPIWLRLVVSLTSVAGFYSTDGINWQIVGSCSMTLPSTYYAGFACYSNIGGTTNTATISNVHQLTGVPQRVRSVTPNWTGTSVGVAPGSFTPSGTSMTVIAEGQGGMGGISDNYYLVNQPSSGNIELTAYVASITNANMYSFGGIMLSDLSTTYPDAPTCVQIGATYSGGTYFGYRTPDGAVAIVVQNSTAAAPLWFRLTISDGAVNAYQSTDGINWTSSGTVLMSFSGTVYLGPMVCSNTTSANTTVQFQSISAALSAGMSSWLRSDVSVSYSGSAVSLWTDQSGVGYNAAQATTANKPALVTNAINGLPAVSFNGTSGFLQFPTGFSDLSNGLSLFIVLKPSAVTALSQIMNLGTGSSNDYNLGLEINSSSEATYFVYDSAGATVTSVSLATAMTTTAQLIEVVQSGTSASIYLRGASAVTNSSMNSIPTPSAGRTANYLGQASAGGHYFNGEIAEVLLYHTALSTADRQAVENYLISKFSL